jgi:N utilization substance protein B
MPTLRPKQTEWFYLPQLPKIVKSSHDPRHLRRIKNMQSLFAHNVGNNELISADSPAIVIHLAEIDQLISKFAPKWPLDKINHLDLAVLRCAVWEIKFNPETPPKVVIDEAVEIAKEFGTDTSGSFVNGVLGGIINQHD